MDSFLRIPRESADDADGRSGPRIGTDGTRIIGSFFVLNALAPEIDKHPDHCLLIDLFQKPVTKRIMNLEGGANDMGGGLP